MPEPTLEGINNEEAKRGNLENPRFDGRYSHLLQNEDIIQP